MMKSNKGITLVALVITIIVLLILAGVSISLVVGDNGIMTRAKDAGKKSGEADAKSAFELAVSAVVTDYWGEYSNGTTVGTLESWVTNARVNTELAKSGYTLTSSDTTIASGCTISNTSGTYTITWEGTGIPKTVTAAKN